MGVEINNMKLNTIKFNTPDGSFIKSQYDLTLIIDENDELIVIDNTKEDWKEYVDCETKVVKHYLIDKK